MPESIRSRDRGALSAPACARARERPFGVCVGVTLLELPPPPPEVCGACGGGGCCCCLPALGALFPSLYTLQADALHLSALFARPAAGKRRARKKTAAATLRTRFSPTGM